MKFTCEKCGTKYTIPDERAAGRRLKIRCKNCSEIITVWGKTELNAALPPLPPAGNMPDNKNDQTDAHSVESREQNHPDSEWYFALNDIAQGPVSIVEMKELLWAGMIDADTYVWCKGMENWARLVSVSDFTPDLSDLMDERVQKLSDGPQADDVKNAISNNSFRSENRGWFDTPGLPSSEIVEGTGAGAEPAEHSGNIRDAGPTADESDAGVGLINIPDEENEHPTPPAKKSGWKFLVISLSIISVIVIGILIWMITNGSWE